MPHAGREDRDFVTWPGRALVMLLAGLAVPAIADDWKIEARGVVTVQTSLSGATEADRAKFQPGLRAEVVAPVVFGTKTPHAIADAVARVSLVDFPQPGQSGEPSGQSKPAATFALALERQVGRGRLAGAEPAQRVATALGVEAGYASPLGGAGSVASKWVAAVARLTEERDGLSVRVGGGVARVGSGKWNPAVVAGLAVPMRGPLSWVWVGADGTFLREGDSVQVWIGAGFK